MKKSIIPAITFFVLADLAAFKLMLITDRFNLLTAIAVPAVLGIVAVLIYGTSN